MLGWLNSRKTSDASFSESTEMGGKVTGDPLAIIDMSHGHLYSVTRSVVLPRLSVQKKGVNEVAPSFCHGGGVNPLFKENQLYADSRKKIRKNSYINRTARKTSTQSQEKDSSGYGSSNVESNQDEIYNTSKYLKPSAIIVNKDPNYVKSIRVSRKNIKVPSSGSDESNCSPHSTLNAIPEGKVDSPVPKPIWPQDNERLFDSIVDDALLLYTSLNYISDGEKSSLGVQLTVTELLMDILKSVNMALEKKSHDTPEDLLKTITERITYGLETLKNSTEEDMKKLCLNLKNCKKVNSVLRAFSNSSSSGSPEWSSSNKPRSSSSEDFYHSSTPSSSSGSLKIISLNSPVLNSNEIDERLRINSNLVSKETLRVPIEVSDGLVQQPQRKLLQSDERPSVWQQYYGVKAPPPVKKVLQVPKPADVPIFPGGRPEADFTLDVPRSEHLLQKMKEDKRWRFRCRLLTSFLGLVFFLLSVMAVSLMLTRGKRMFGSMM